MDYIRTIGVFGATGSVGLSTLDIIASNSDAYDVKVLTANQNYQKLAELTIQHNANTAILADDKHYLDLKQALSGKDVQIECGRDALIEAAKTDLDWSMGAIVGMAGLLPLLEQIQHSKVVAIANKEPLVSAAPFILSAAKEYKTVLLPVDSEHNAIFQAMQGNRKVDIQKIVLTASGGPFLRKSVSDLIDITPEQAVKHPNWSMGAKISVDSATMMNKALEVIEACHFFGFPKEKIDVIIHPQSVVHGMVEYNDGSYICQMGPADMRTPIANALGYPNRIKTSGDTLDINKLSSLDFSPVDLERFPAVKMAYDVLAEGVGSCIAFNAANEIAVEKFLDKRISFLDIINIVTHIISLGHVQNFDTVHDVVEYDSQIRKKTQDYIKTKKAA